MNQLLVYYDGAGREIALMEEGQLVEYHRDGRQGGLSNEDIYLGQVGRVMKNLAAAFVRLSRDSEGFLPFAEIPSGQVPRPGDAILVQVKKPPQGGKAAYLTASIALPGSLLILTPLSPARHVSKRVRDEAERRRLLALAGELAPEGTGLIMREDSQGRALSELLPEYERLRDTWVQVQLAAAQRSAPCPVLEAPDELTRLLREARVQPDRVLSNRPEALEGLPVPADFSEDPMRLFEVRGRLEKALRRKVHLKSGATLVIDPCEALTVIDVNTAQNVAGRDRARALRDTNVEAAQAIARLLRLRRIGGIVLIDFIDMDGAEDRALVLRALGEALERDPVKTAVHGFTSLGLVELTRKKSDTALAAQTLRTCPRCRGLGLVEDREESDA